MKRLASRVAWIFTLIALLCLTVRLFWIASHLETGLPTLATDWRNSTLSWLVGSYIPVPERPPREQAEFWLAETDRILGQHPNDARLTMAAALVLDCPGTDFMRSHLQAIQVTTFGSVPEMDSNAIRRGNEEFERRCQDRCLELAAKATDLDPNNVDWWRLRAVLLFRSLGFAEVQRGSQWLKAIDECQSHDPDNALYDYLVANVRFLEGLKHVYTDKSRFVVQDEQAFQDATRRVNLGQVKPFLVVGDTGFSAAAELLKIARIAPTDHPKIINSREIHLRQSMLAMLLFRWLWRLAESKLTDDHDIEASMKLYRQALHLVDQIQAATLDNNVTMLQMKVSASNWMRTASAGHTEAISPAENEQIIAANEEALLEQRILIEAARTLPKNQPKPKRGLTFLGILANLAEIFVAIAPQLIVTFLSVGVGASIALRILGPHNATLGPLAHLIALATAALITIVVFALAPAEIIPRQAQAWTVTIGVLLVPFGLFCWFGWRSLRRRAYQFSLRAMLIATLILSLLFGIAVSPVGQNLFGEIPFRISIPPVVRGDAADAESFGQWFTAQGAQAWWTAAQWVAYHGHLWTIALWTALVGLIHQWKLQRLARRNVLPLSALTFNRRIAGFFASVTRPAFVISALLLLLYLLIEPSHLQEIDRQYQQDMAFARDPAAYWKMVEDAVQNVRANNQLMAEISSSVSPVP